jgi:hypothetical protein
LYSIEKLSYTCAEFIYLFWRCRSRDAASADETSRVPLSDIILIRLQPITVAYLIEVVFVVKLLATQLTRGLEDPT